MIYKFKKWVILPAYTEVFINATSTLNWQEADSIEQRMTYEVLDEKS
jgi:hypothetical protein